MQKEKNARKITEINLIAKIFRVQGLYIKIAEIIHYYGYAFNTISICKVYFKIHAYAYDWQPFFFAHCKVEYLTKNNQNEGNDMLCRL